MNDYDLIRQTFSEKEIKGYQAIRSFQQGLGKKVEDYINTKLPIPNVTFVGRDKNRPEGVDYIVNGEYYSVKNAYNTENNSAKKFREDRDIHHWYRLNSDGSTNWETCFVRGCSEREFLLYVTGKCPIGLDQFMDCGRIVGNSGK